MQTLKKWLKQPGNSKAKMATLLGYESSTTINNWLTRGRIPKREIERVEKITRRIK